MSTIKKEKQDKGKIKNQVNNSVIIKCSDEESIEYGQAIN